MGMNELECTGYECETRGSNTEPSGLLSQIFFVLSFHTQKYDDESLKTFFQTVCSPLQTLFLPDRQKLSNKLPFDS